MAFTPLQLKPRPTKSFTALSTAQDLEEERRKRLREEAQIAAEQARVANSFVGLAKETLKGTVSRVANIIPNAAKATYATYQHVGQELPAREAETFQEIKNHPLNTPKIVAKATFRNAGDFATAVFAPISAAIGSALEATGSDRLIDKTGQVVADKSGITNWKGFQQFALSHPNAGEDFNRLLNLVGFAGAEGGKPIRPSEIADKSLTFANKLAGGNDKTLKGAQAALEVRFPEIKNESEGGTPNIIRNERRIPIEDQSASETNIPFNNDYRLREPDIQMGSGRVPSNLPTVRYPEPSPNRVGPYTYEPVEAPKPTPSFTPIAEPVRTRSAPKTEAPTVENVPVRNTNTAPAPVESAVPAEFKPESTRTAESSRGTKLLKSAVERNLIADAKDSPRHDVIDQHAQADLAVDYVMSNYEHALEIAMGRERAPSNLLPQAIYHAAEKVALRKGDVRAIMKLQDSPIPSLTGQGLKALDSADADSPARIIRDLNREKTAKAEKKGVPAGRQESKLIATERKALHEEIKKEASNSRPDWETFIKDITCGY